MKIWQLATFKIALGVIRVLNPTSTEHSTSIPFEKKNVELGEMRAIFFKASRELNFQFWHNNSQVKVGFQSKKLSTIKQHKCLHCVASERIL